MYRTCGYINQFNIHLYTLLIPNNPSALFHHIRPRAVDQHHTIWFESQHWIYTVISCHNCDHTRKPTPITWFDIFNTLLLTKGVEEVGNLLDASSDDLYVLSVGPILLDWSLVALNMTLVMRMVRHCCWHKTELRRHTYFHWIKLFLLSNQGTVYYRPLKDPLPEG